jgi:hypothetical protein
MLAALIMFMRRLLLASLIMCGFGLSANAEIVSYPVPNLSNNGDPADTVYSGSGYAGAAQGGHGFQSILEGAFHLRVGADSYHFVLLVVDISNLLGKTINSAFLQYDVQQGSPEIEMRFKAFVGNSTFNPFTSSYISSHQQGFLMYGSAVSRLGSNILDVEDYVNAALLRNAEWLGLMFIADFPYPAQQITLANSVGESDVAQMRLVVDYGDATPVPEPATAALIVLGLFGFAACRRCRSNIITVDT